MSDTDSFIEEVTEEVRRDKLFGYLKRYGWIAGVAVVLIVGGASWSEWRKAQAVAAAEDTGDTLIAALVLDDSGARAAALADVSVDNPDAQMIVDLITATEQSASGNTEDALTRFNAVAENGEASEIYRQIAQFKAMLIETDSEARRNGFETIARPGHPLRLLAEEQLALVEIESGKTEAAIERLQSVISDAETSRSLQQRALQVIVALGGTPELPAGTPAEN